MRGSSGPGEIQSRILTLRGCRVMLDADLAKLYGVSTKALVQGVARNRKRFPADFVFQLKEQELAILRSQIVTSSWGGRRTAPYAFSEQGVAMLSSVLRSEKAIAVNIAIMRAFVRIREITASNAQLTRKLDELERRVTDHDESISSIVRAIRELAAPPEPKPGRRIGFVQED
jgi:hypothetical protein